MVRGVEMCYKRQMKTIAIAPVALVEIYGPLFPLVSRHSNVQYRLTEEHGITRVRFAHRAIGQIPAELRDSVNVNKGWTHLLERVRAAAESRGRKK